MTHAWHDVTPGEHLPTAFSAVIEIPMGSSVKYELDKETGMLRLDTNDPADLAALIENGMIWRGGPKAIQRAIFAIGHGAVPRPTRNVPPDVDAYLDRLGVTRSN